MQNKLFRLLRPSAFRCGHRYLTTSQPLIKVGSSLKTVQGSVLRLNIDESVKNVQVIIETKWDEEVEIKSSLPHSLHSTIKVESNSKDISVSIGKELQDIAQGFVLHICIPEYFDLSIKGPAMQLKLQNKVSDVTTFSFCIQYFTMLYKQLMGNFLLVIPDGSVSIDKVKGSQIGIFAGEGTCFSQSKSISSIIHLFNHFILQLRWILRKFSKEIFRFSVAI